MPDLTEQTAENIVEDVTKTAGSTVEEAAEEESASKYKIERAVAGIPGAISDRMHRDKDGQDGGSPDNGDDSDPSKHRIERAVAGVPGALTNLKDKKLEQDTAQHAAAAAGQEGEPEHKLERVVVGIPDQLSALEDEAAEHVKPVIEQNSADAKAKSHEIGAGAVMILVALVIAIFGIPVVLLGIAEALALVLPLWASLLIVGAVLLVIAGICTYSAKGHFSKAGEYDVSLKAGIRKSFDYFFKGIGMPDEMAEELRESK